MKAAFVLLASCLALAGNANIKDDGWIYDGPMSCIFDQSRGPQPCKQYRREGSVSTWQYLWKNEQSEEVRYEPHLGLIGVSRFTIGEFQDKRCNGGEKIDAASFEPDRERLVIGVPDEGCMFYVNQPNLPDFD